MIGLSLFLTACGSGYVYHSKKDIPDSIWSYADSIDFKVTIQDTNAIYNLFLILEHASDYSYQNLYTKIKTQFPEGERLDELVSLELAEKNLGWLGDCNSKTCKLKIPIQQGAFFSQPGDYIFSFHQFMRKDSITGIKSLSFAIEDTGNRKE